MHEPGRAMPAHKIIIKMLGGAFMARIGGKHAAPSKKTRKEPEWKEELEYEEAYEEQPAQAPAPEEEESLDWEPGWEPESERKRKKTPGWVKAVRTLVILLVILAVALIAMDLVQRDRFAGGSDVNGVDVSRLTAEGAEAAVSSALELDKAVVLLDEQGGQIAQLRLGDLLRGSDLYSQMDKLIGTQHEKFAPLAFAGIGGGSYSLGWLDDSSIEALIEGAIGDYGKTDPQPSTLVKGANGWELTPAKNGSKPDTAGAAAELKQILNGSSLADKGSVAVTVSTLPVVGSFAENDAKLKAQMDAIDSALGQDVSINFGAGTVITLGKAELSKIYDVTLTDDGADVELNADALKETLDAIIAYNKLDGIDRKYSLIDRDELHYNDWDTGWALKSETLLKDVTKALKSGGGEVQAGYNYVAAVKKHFKNGNNSFIEIDLENQYLWFYRKGNLVLSTPIVSGDVATGTETPKGAFSVSYKQKNARIAGKGYSYTVNYWIPFYGNIGIHDAEWRETGFGGDVYLTEGSHGCVEVPMDIIEEIYNNASTYIPVFVY